MNDSTPEPNSNHVNSVHLLRRLRIGLWIAAALLGFVHIWANRHFLNEDALSYLDIADAYLRRDWSNAINSYWSPLYSWLLALALIIVKPSPYWKFAVLHIVNFGLYLVALACFDQLLREFTYIHRKEESTSAESTFTSFPDWGWLALGFPLFIWSSIYIITVRFGTPDLLVAAVVYFVSALLLRIRRQPDGWLPFVLLGIALGIGYLAKSVMFPLSFVFLVVSMFSVGNPRRALPRGLLALVLVLVLAAPFVILISRARGRVTFGDSGKLNYAWTIDQLSYTHWQGEGSDNGSPKHPTRKILDSPAIYEFGEPIAGTFPVWYDPVYWHEGIKTHFDLKGQLKALEVSAEHFYELFFSNVTYGLLVGFFSLYLVSNRRLKLLKDLTPQLSLIIPALAALGLYSLVTVEERYVAPFVVILSLSLFSSLRLPKGPQSKRFLHSILVVLSLMMLLTVVGSSTAEATITARSLLSGEKVTDHPQWQVAQGLRQFGLAPGDKVAVIGNSFNAFWAHLLNTRIVAEIEADDAESFWRAPQPVKDKAIHAFASTGAKAIVTEQPSLDSEALGWQRIGESEYYVYLLPKPDETTSPQR